MHFTDVVVAAMNNFSTVLRTSATANIKRAETAIGLLKKNHFLGPVKKIYVTHFHNLTVILFDKHLYFKTMFKIFWAGIHHFLHLQLYY